MHIVSNCLRVHGSFCKFGQAVAKITYEHGTNEHRKLQQIQLECAVDGTPSQIPTPVANVANSMTDGWTCSPTPLP